MRSCLRVQDSSKCVVGFFESTIYYLVIYRSYKLILQLSATIFLYHLYTSHVPISFYRIDLTFVSIAVLHSQKYPKISPNKMTLREIFLHTHYANFCIVPKIILTMMVIEAGVIKPYRTKISD